DACAFLCRFNNGSLGLFESTRYARGHKALYTFEINGEHMSLKWDLHDLHRLQIYDHKDVGAERGWKSIHVSDGDHPYCGKWWVPGLQLGYEHSFVHAVVEFIKALEAGTAAKPDFKDGLATDYVVDAVLDSGKSGKWVKVKQTK
ncbi:MAG: oxidoreductase, partial [Pedosphaera sp. Tous-C6FEB]